MSDVQATTEATLRTDSSKYNQGTLQKQLIHEELNSASNWHTIVSAVKSGRARDISQEPKVDKLPTLIIGSGPSLDHSIQFMKDWKGGIFCTTSQAVTLFRYGVEPTHIVCLDPFCRWEELEGIDWSKTRSKLIIHPGVWPDLVEKWPNEILLYIESLGKKDSFYATTQKRMYTWRDIKDGNYRDPVFNFYIPTEITLFACSPPIQMFMADLLGYGSSFLCGVDFAYHKDKERFTGWTMDNGAWIEHKHPFVQKDGVIETNNGLFSEEIHLYYKKNFLTAWRLSSQTVYTTDHGALTEVPYVSIEKVVRQQGRNFASQSKPFIADRTEKYLATVRAFVVETKAGYSFVESNNPPEELTHFMLDMFSIYRCSECKVELKCDDYNEHSEDECPHCKKGKLSHVHEIDIVYNTEKFMKLLRLAGVDTKKEDWCFKIPVKEETEAEKKIKNLQTDFDLLLSFAKLSNIFTKNNSVINNYLPLIKKYIPDLSEI